MKVGRIRRELNISLREISRYLELPLLVYLYYEIFGVEQMHYDVYMDFITLLDNKKKSTL